MNPVTIAIPVRSFHDGKTRLAAVLPERERLELVRNMLNVVIQAALDSGVAEKIVLVSADEAVLAFAHSLGAQVAGLRQPTDRPGLISAAQLARRSAIEEGVGRLLILFGDLPTVTPEDIREILKERTPVVIATDWIGGGSNGLLLNLNDPVTHDFQFAYGSGSRWLHEQEALRLGLEVTTIVTGGVAHDLDTTEDFRALIASGRKIPDWLRTLPIPHQETRV